MYYKFKLSIIEFYIFNLRFNYTKFNNLFDCEKFIF